MNGNVSTIEYYDRGHCVTVVTSIKLLKYVCNTIELNDLDKSALVKHYISILTSLLYFPFLSPPLQSLPLSTSSSLPSSNILSLVCSLWIP